MSARRLGVLVAVALFVVAAALWLSSERGLKRNASAGELVFPTLLASLNDLTEVRLAKAGGKTAVTLKRAEKSWGVVERGQYPADDGRLRKLLIDLAELRVVEQKTSDPAKYPVLGVEDVNLPDASGVRIELVGLPEPLALVVGKSAGSRSTYARVADSATGIAVTPALTIDSEPQNWLNRTLIDIAPARVQQVRVSPNGDTPYAALRESRDQTDLTVPALPKGRELASPTSANPLASALSGLSFEDVRTLPAAEQWGEDSARTEFRLFDGTTIEVVGREDDDQNWIRLAVHFDEAQQQRFAAAAAPVPQSASPSAAPGAADAAQAPATPAPAATAGEKPEETRAQVELLAARFDGWAFEIPAYQYDALFRPLKDLLKAP